MTYRVDISKEAKKVLKKWKKSNPRLRKKCDELLIELAEHPYTGKGHPEPLVGKGGITYSRRITAHDRIIYDIYDDIIVVLVIAVEGHYDDK